MYVTLMLMFGLLGRLTPYFSRLSNALTAVSLEIAREKEREGNSDGMSLLSPGLTSGEVEVCVCVCMSVCLCVLEKLSCKTSC